MSKIDHTRLFNQVSWIRQSIENDRTRIPESEFKRLFIPLLTGQIPEDQLKDIGLNPWIAVAGTATRWVDIVDINDKVLYSVPPLLNTVGVTNTNRDANNAVGTRLEKTLREVERMPRNGHDRIATTLINSISASQPNVEQRQAWAKVLKENGIDIPDDVDKTKSKEDEGSLFGEDYDEL